MDTTERLHFHFLLSCIGEGNGNPLQCSCLENPRDEGAWWAAIYGVTQSRTRLKQLSSSSSIFSFQDRKSNVSELQQPCPSPGLIGVKVKVKSLSRVQLFATPWTIAHQVPPSTEFSRPILEWVAISFSRGIFSTQGLNPGLPHRRQMLYHLSHQWKIIFPFELKKKSEFK